jgi:hypothetical protein
MKVRRVEVEELTFAFIDEQVFQQSIGIAMDTNCVFDNTLHIQKAKTARTLANSLQSIGEIHWSMDMSLSAKRREKHVNGSVVVS